MTSTSSLDTCVLIRLITKDNEKLYKKALALVCDSNQTFVVDDAAIIETVHVLSSVYHQSRQEIAEGLTVILTSDSIKVNQQTLDQILPLYLSHPSLSFTDIYLAQKAERSHSEPLWTFDKKLSTQLSQPKLIP